MFTVILFYKYVDIETPEQTRIVQRTWCEELGLTGRVLIAREGINATLEGKDSAIAEYINRMESSDFFKGINFKSSQGTGKSFPKLQVKVRSEIVVTKIEDRDLGPLGGVTGNYLEADVLHQWYESNKEFVVIDMRNDYEYEIGRFKDSIIPGSLKNFRDLHKILPEVEHLKDKTVVTVCTGGIRCEKASGFLKKHGFKDVHQLHNGMHTYIEKYPNKYFEGKLYMFDERLTWAPESDSPDHKSIGICRMCGASSEHIINWYEGKTRKHGIVCKTCVLNGIVLPDSKGTHFHVAT
jgi:UPF0176 protein